MKLKAQFEEALNIKNSFEKIKNENVDLLSKLHKAESQNCDLQTRLKITISSYNDKINKQTNEYAQQIEILENENNKIKQELQFYIDNDNKQIKDMENKINDLTNNLNNERAINKNNQKQFSSIFKSSSIFFAENIDTMSKLINAFSLNKHYKDDGKEQIDKYERYIKKIKKQFAKIKDDNQLFKEKLDEAINDNNELQTNYQKEKENIINELNTKFNNKEKVLKEKIHELELKNSDLLFQLKTVENLNNEMKSSMQLFNDEKKTKSDVDNDINQNNIAKIINLKKIILKLKKLVQDKETIRLDLENDLNKSKNTISELKDEKNKIKQEMDFVLKQNEIYKNENESLHKSLLEFSTNLMKEQQNEVEKSNNNLQQEYLDTIENLEKDNKHFKERIILINDEKEKLENLNKDLQVQLKSIKDQKSTYSEVSSSCNEKEDKIISQSIIGSNFPSVLSSKLLEIINNVSLQDSTKVNLTINEINKYYIQEIKLLSEKLSELREHNKIMKSIINSLCFLPEISEQIVSNIFENPQKIISLIKDLNTTFNEIALTNKEKEVFLNQLCEQLNCINYSEIPFIIKKERKKNDKCNSDLLSLQKKLKRIKAQNNENKKELDSKTKLLYNELQISKQNQIELKQKLQEQIEQLEITEKEKQNLINELHEHKNQIKELKYEIEAEHNNMKINQNNSSEMHNKNITLLNNIINKLESKVQKYFTIIKVLKEKILQKEAIIQQIKAAHENEDISNQKKYENEKNYIKENYDKIISEIQVKSLKYKNKIVSMNENINKLNDKIESYQLEISDLRNEKKLCEMKLKNLHEQYDLDKKIFENRIKT